MTQGQGRVARVTFSFTNGPSFHLNGHANSRNPAVVMAACVIKQEEFQSNNRYPVVAAMLLVVLQHKVATKHVVT